MSLFSYIKASQKSVLLAFSCAKMKSIKGHCTHHFHLRSTILRIEKNYTFILCPHTTKLFPLRHDCVQPYGDQHEENFYLSFLDATWLVFRMLDALLLRRNKIRIKKNARKSGKREKMIHLMNTMLSLVSLNFLSLFSTLFLSASFSTL